VRQVVAAVQCGVLVRFTIDLPIRSRSNAIAVDLRVGPSPQVLYC